MSTETHDVAEGDEAERIDALYAAIKTWRDKCECLQEPLDATIEEATG